MPDSSSEVLEIRPIGHIESCYRERFGIPRQPGLVSEARAVLTLNSGEPELLQGLRGIEGFSHLWVMFVFHDAIAEGWKGLVRPPRLGGTVKMGVFATRSPHRPNPIGISAVELEKVEGGKLHLKGVDFLDGTPVIDIKPYIAYADSIPAARLGWVESEPAVAGSGGLDVEFTPESQAFVDRMAFRGFPKLKDLITQTLRLDPRPAYHAQTDLAGEPVEYGIRLSDFDVHWKVMIESKRCEVTRIDDLRK